MATWIMEMEEEGMDEFGFIPETVRCWGETFELNVVERVAKIRCWQNVREEGGFVERKATFRW